MSSGHPTYHAGEIEVQTRAGVRSMAKRVGGGIHDTLIAGAAELIALQPMVVVGGTDSEGHVWASLLTGSPGFVQAFDVRTVRLRANPATGDPFADILAATMRASHAAIELGVLIIDLKTRERMRLNGLAEADSDGNLFLHIREVYFNCPKYIQKRDITRAESPESHATAADVTHFGALTPSQRQWIRTADTFFVASVAPGGGADASHRGGNPGFVRVRDAVTLEWPDYSGNAMFNTLGNITVNPRAGLLFPDFETGATLQLTGQATVIWEPERARVFAGAERVVEFRVEKVVEAAHAVPLHFRLLQYSRFNPAQD